MTISQPESYSPKSKSIDIIDSWIAYDFEWTTKKYEKFRLPKIDENASGGSEAPVFGDREYNEIVTFAFEDSNGNKGVLDITDFQSVKSFLEAIKEKLLQYPYCFGWGSKSIKRKNPESGQLEGINGDLVVLDSNFKANRIPSIVRYNEYSNIPFLKKDIFTNTNQFLVSDIDLLQVFAKPLVKSILGNKYKSLRLGDVSKALLDHGKLDNKTGAKLDEMSVDGRKSYCLNDAHLVAELARVENGNILKIMQVIASHTGLTFEEVCHKGMAGIWKKIINEAISKKIKIVGYENISFVLRKLYSNNMSYGKYADYFDETEYDEEDEEDELLEYKENFYDHYIDKLDQQVRNRNSSTTENNCDITYSNNNTGNNGKSLTKNKYKGGLVFIPIIGLHNDVYLNDTSSMYPTMIINYNVSPETVNCSCCRYNLHSKIDFNEDDIKDFKYLQKKDDNRYWICKMRKGLFSTILHELTEKRLQYKREGKELESTSIKALINSGYGVFGYSNFKYYDPRVAEIVTALGRKTLREMKKIATEMGFTVLYGDSDSIFSNNIKGDHDISRFIDNCKKKLNVDVTHEKTFRKLILVVKKHYIGIPHGNDKPVIKGMEGIKSDRPEFIQTTFREMVEDIKNDTNPIPKLKGALEELDQRQIPIERLVISLVLKKDPGDYIHDDKQKRLGTKLRLRKGDTLTYYKCDKQETIIGEKGKEKTRTVSESENPDDISYAKYKETFLNSVKDVIEILGYDVEKDLTKRKLKLS
ncbi:hypothetical protein BH23THE1_BH23THE1_28330 [soil metagenome]